MLQGNSRMFKIELMKLACIVFQFQDNATYPLCFDDSHNAVDLIVLPWIYRFVLCI